jgi:hypothetical protein
MSEIYDFRGSEPGKIVVVTTEQGSFTFTKESESAALEGWKMGEVAVRFVVMEPPFITSGAVVRTGHELAIEREDDPRILRSLGGSPLIIEYTSEDVAAMQL